MPDLRLIRTFGVDLGTSQRGGCIRPSPCVGPVGIEPTMTRCCSDYSTVIFNSLCDVLINVILSRITFYRFTPPQDMIALHISPLSVSVSSRKVSHDGSDLKQFSWRLIADLNKLMEVVRLLLLMTSRIASSDLLANVGFAVS